MPESGSPYWRRNLWVCVAGSFTTLVGMTLLLPFLPLYVEELGVHDHAAIVQWSGIAYGATFLTAALTAPLWGRLGDRYGRKLMLIRASLGMAVSMSLMGLATDVHQLVGLRLLTGLLGGYASGSMILVAAQTPKDRSGWALGVMSSGIMAGSLVGPLLGGWLPPLVGIRNAFFLIGGIIFVAFLATWLLIRETPVRRGTVRPPAMAWKDLPDRGPLIAMLVCGCLLMFANMSIEPIITVYAAQLIEPSKVTMLAGLTMAAAALGSILSAPHWGRLADRIGHWKVVEICLLSSAVLLLPQAFVQSPWQLVALRFAMGVALGGLLPCIAAVIRHSVPERATGSALGYSTSAQYVGQVLGPLMGGYVGGHHGMRAVFLGTAAVMVGGWAFSAAARRRAGAAQHDGRAAGSRS